jgi:hypothetical protein
MLGSIARHMRLPTIAPPCWGVLFVICGYLHYCASHEENPSILMLSQPARVGVIMCHCVCNQTGGTRGPAKEHPRPLGERRWTGIPEQCLATVQDFSVIRFNPTLTLFCEPPHFWMSTDGLCLHMSLCMVATTTHSGGLRNKNESSCRSCCCCCCCSKNRAQRIRRPCRRPRSTSTAIVWLYLAFTAATTTLVVKAVAKTRFPTAALGTSHCTMRGGGSGTRNDSNQDVPLRTRVPMFPLSRLPQIAWNKIVCCCTLNNCTLSIC